MSILDIDTEQTNADAEWLFNNATAVLQDMVDKFKRMFGPKVGHKDYVSYLFTINIGWATLRDTDLANLTYNYYLYDSREKQIRGLITLYRNAARDNNIPITSIHTRSIL